jgi:hypothetical protein
MEEVEPDGVDSRPNQPAGCRLTMVDVYTMHVCVCVCVCVRLSCADGGGEGEATDLVPKDP